ncbi:MAG TPA: agmatinase family protein [Candidatus Limnocylindrales bacterium]|nr:agmatinase family protein [Candidatus Limnocylindrales bacterium]
MAATFDPGAPAAPDSGLFGLTLLPEECAVHVLPVPFDATASYRKGAWRAPEAILRASRQVDLFDLATGKPYEAGICLLEGDGRAAEWNREASELAGEVIAAAGVVAGNPRLERALERVNAIQGELNTWVRERTTAVLDDGRLPAILGGDHSAPFGAIEACAERSENLGILHFDAHADLRHAYEGFEWSHASIMDNVARRLPRVSTLLQVGLRDLSEEEHAAIEGSGGRIRAVLERDWSSARLEGRNLRELARDAIASLPSEIYVSFDVDGLDPALCPRTGTPVPGGLSWSEAMLWLEELARSGRRVVGLDLCEVNPGPPAEEDSWDAIVGARLLYRLIGTALLTRG